jgi:hypothetical protein
VGATTVTDIWVRMAYLQFSRIIMAWFKLSLIYICDVCDDHLIYMMLVMVIVIYMMSVMNIMIYMMHVMNLMIYMMHVMNIMECVLCL